MATSRSDVLRAAAQALSAASPFSAFVGFDGFIDLILRPVATRASMKPGDFTPVRTMSAFGDRVLAAAGKSTNIETVLTEKRFGGNGPLMAGALGRLGLIVTYAGAVGTEPRVNSALDAVFVPFADRCIRVVTLGPPSTTSCYEFDDGKLMLNDRSNVQAVTWAGVKQAFGEHGLRESLSRARLLGVVNWSLLGGMQGILEGLAQEALPKLAPLDGGQKRRIFVDLADPTPRADRDLVDCLRVLTEMNAVPGVAVTLGLNLMESEHLVKVLNLSVSAAGSLPSFTTAAAHAIRERLKLDCVVIHPREGAAAATADASAWWNGPLCEHPKLSTGAGDHFNAGFALAQCMGLPLDQCLAIATSTSGAYVRDAESPTLIRVAEMLQSQA